MIQIISKNGKVLETNKSSTPYPADVINRMKKAGYKIKEIKDEKGLEK